MVTLFLSFPLSASEERIYARTHARNGRARESSGGRGLKKNDEEIIKKEREREKEESHVRAYIRRLSLFLSCAVQTDGASGALWLWAECARVVRAWP